MKGEQFFPHFLTFPLFHFLSQKTEDELLGIITGEVLAEMAFGENKVHQTIYRVVHSHCRSKRKVSFSDFLSIFEKIKAELRVPDVLYLSIDLMNNARNKHQFIMVSAERSVVG